MGKVWAILGILGIYVLIRLIIILIQKARLGVLWAKILIIGSIACAGVTTFIIFVPYGWQILVGICGLALILWSLPIIARKIWWKQNQAKVIELTASFPRHTGVPIKKEWLLANVPCAIHLCEIDEQIKEKENELESAPKENKRAIREALYNLKLDAFYELSIQGETSAELYEIFSERLETAREKNDYNILRHDDEEELILNNKDTELMNLINEGEKVIKRNVFSKSLKEITDISNESVEGLFGFTSTSALRSKTERMQQVWEDVQAFAASIEDNGHNVNMLLQYARIRAYRNIFLGQELINYLMSLQEGGEISTEKSIAMADMSDITNFSVTGLDLTAPTSMFESFQTYRDTKNLLGGLGFEKGTSKAIGMGAAMVLNALKELEQEKKNHIKFQNEIMKQMKIAEDQILYAQAGLLDALKIVRAINDANYAFVKYYVPLRSCVFEKHEFNKISKDDLIQLNKVLEQYEDISKAAIGKGPNITRYEAMKLKAAEAASIESNALEVPTSQSATTSDTNEHKAKASKAILVDEVQVKSPIQGNVIKIFVSEGKVVKKGNILLSIESMNTEENTITADQGGIVKKIVVSRGQNVMQDDLLIIIEKPKE